MEVSFITTVFNEEKTIEPFLDSLFKQTQIPDEIIIVDGGSSDATVKRIKDVRLKFKIYNGRVEIFIKKGNRSIGRNEAVKHTTGKIIVCSDAGNILDKNWIKEIIAPFTDKKIDVVAGYYQGMAKNAFQKCLIPYVLVMPDRVDPNSFLPATRSVAFTKAIWEKVGGFNENFSHNEDYVFAKCLQKVRAKIIFKKEAVVYWFPRTNLKQAFVMFFRFAYGDAEARIYRPKVIFLFIRYLVGIFLLAFAIMIQSVAAFLVLLILFLLYLLWAAVKNYRYVHMWQAFYLLPLIQVTADMAVIKGTILGMLNRKISY